MIRPSFFEYVRAVARGESVARLSMNAAIQGMRLSGSRILDIGGAKHVSYRFRFVVIDGANFESIDGATHSIDFEIDELPYADAEFDSAICLNVLEHVYNHSHLVAQMKRVLSSGGQVVCFTPFFVQYHPDPRDYFRYTSEALERIFSDAGFIDIKVVSVGMGPFDAAFNHFVQYLPRAVAVMCSLFVYPLSSVFMYMRPKLVSRFPLGYLLVAHTPRD